MKKRLSTKLLSLFLAVIMVVTSIPFTAITASAADSGPLKDNDDAYLFAYFTGNGAVSSGGGTTQAIRFAVSTDGYNFEPVNGNSPVITQNNGTLNCRDPYIFKGNDGKYYIIATDMDANLGWSSNDSFVLWESTDLLNWTNETIINVQELVNKYFPDANNDVERAWAPQVLWDNSTNQYFVYFALKTSGSLTNGSTYMYYMYTTDLMDQSKYSAPAFLHKCAVSGHEGHDAIDGDIWYDNTNNKYVMYYKDEHDGSDYCKFICYATSDYLAGPYTDHGKLFDGGYEGCNAYRLADGTFLMACDEYGPEVFRLFKASGSDSTIDHTKFTLLDESEYSLDVHPRHGSMIQITGAQYNSLVNKYGYDNIFGSHVDFTEDNLTDHILAKWFTTSSSTYDASGKGNYLTTHNLEYSSIAGKNAFKFTSNGNSSSNKDGGSYASISNLLSSVAATKEFSISFDAYLTKYDNDRLFDITDTDTIGNTTWANHNNYNYIYMSTRTSSTNFGINLKDKSEVAKGTVAFDTNKWNHFLITCDSNLIQIYVNNKLVTSQICTTPLTDEFWNAISKAKFYIGVSTFNDTMLDGYLANYYVYDIALNAKEQENIQNASEYKEENNQHVYSYLTNNITDGISSSYNVTWDSTENAAKISKGGLTINGTPLKNVNAHTGLAVSMDVKIDSGSEYWGRLFSAGNSQSSTKNLFEINGGNGDFNTYEVLFAVNDIQSNYYTNDFNNATYCSTTSDPYLTVGTWVNIKIVMNPDWTMEYYINNELRAVFRSNYHENNVGAGITAEQKMNNFSSFDRYTIAGKSMWNDAEMTGYIKNVYLYDSAYAFEKNFEKNNIKSKIDSAGFNGYTGVTSAADSSYTKDSLVKNVTKAGESGSAQPAFSDEMENVLFTEGTTVDKYGYTNLDGFRFGLQFGNIVFLYSDGATLACPINAYGRKNGSTSGKRKFRGTYPNSSSFELRHSWHGTSTYNTYVTATSNLGGYSASTCTNNMYYTDNDNSTTTYYYSNTLYFVKTLGDDVYSYSEQPSSWRGYNNNGTTGDQGDYTNTNVGTVYAVNYNPIKKILSTVKSEYENVKANEHLYTTDSLNKYYAVVANIVAFDFSKYNFASDPAGQSDQCGKDIAAAAAAYTTDILEKTSAKITFKMNNGESLYYYIPYGESILDYAPANTKAVETTETDEYKNIHSVHTVYSWPDATVNGDATYNEIETTENHSLTISGTTATCSKCGFSATSSYLSNGFRITKGNMFNFDAFSKTESAKMYNNSDVVACDIVNDIITVAGSGKDAYTKYSPTDGYYKFDVQPGEHYVLSYVPSDGSNQAFCFFGSNGKYNYDKAYNTAKYSAPAGEEYKLQIEVPDYEAIDSIDFRFGVLKKGDICTFSNIALYKTDENYNPLSYEVIESNIPSGTSFENAVTNVENVCSWDSHPDTVKTNLNVEYAEHTWIEDAKGIFVCSICEGIKKDGEEVIDLTAYYAAVASAQASIANTIKYTEDSINALQAVINKNKLDPATDNIDSVNAKTAAIQTANKLTTEGEGGVLELHNYTVTFNYVSNNETVTVIDNVKYKYGDAVELIVPDSVGQVYKWTKTVNENDSKIAGDRNQITHVVSGNVVITAFVVDEKPETSQQHRVTVYNRINKVVGYMYVENNATLTIDNAKVSSGSSDIVVDKTPYYQITGFTVNGVQISSGYTVTGDVSLYPVYTPQGEIKIKLDKTDYKGIKFTDTDADSKNALWDSKVTVTADTNVTWFVGDVAVAKGTSYSFRATNSITIKAKVDASETGSSIITYANFDSENRKARITVSSYNSDNLVIDEQGIIILTSTVDNDLSYEDIKNNGKYYKATKTTDTGNQFSFTLNIGSSSTIKRIGVVSYVKYKNGSTSYSTTCENIHIA